MTNELAGTIDTPTTAPRIVPTGIGMYIMDLSRKHTGTPAQAAKRAADAGLGFVAILGCWQEKSPSGLANASDLDDYGAAFREADVDVFVWGYPWGSPECIDRFVPTMRKAADMAGARGIILDPELGFKADRAKYMPMLLQRTVDSLDESLGLGITSYGLTSAHPDFPWSIAGGYGFGSPQLYSVPIEVARAAIKQWRMRGWETIIASVPTFGPNSAERLAAYSGAILEHCDGLIFWQWSTTSDAEWRAIAELARSHHLPAPSVDRGQSSEVA